MARQLPKFLVICIATSTFFCLLNYGYKSLPKYPVVRLGANNNAMRELSIVFQDSLKQLQNTESCDSNKLIQCGLYSGCGLACQIHYRMTCAMLSNALQIPFAHFTPKWPYDDPWNKFLEPVGKNCSGGEGVRSWDHDENQAMDKLLKQGLPVPKSMAQIINETFSNETQALYWILGQYAKFAFQLTPEGVEKIAAWKNKLNFSSQGSAKNPRLGIHVRKTDKRVETNVLRTHEDFMEEARIYRNMLLRNNVTFDCIDVFVASEDHTVLPAFQQKFGSKEWNFVGFPSDRTYNNQFERSSQLIQILRDIKILTECDFVICTLSSNVCRLILEIKMYQDFENQVFSPNPENRIKSLDGDYFYHLYPHGAMPLILRYNYTTDIKISPQTKIITLNYGMISAGLE